MKKRDKGKVWADEQIPGELQADDEEQLELQPGPQNYTVNRPWHKKRTGEEMLAELERLLKGEEK